MRHLRIHALRSSDMDPPRLAARSRDHDNYDAANALYQDAKCAAVDERQVTVRRTSALAL
jgi:hypothetical protein